MSFDFIKDLTESRLITSKSNYTRYTLREVADIAFLYFLSLQILRQEMEFFNKTKSYSNDVLKYSNFNNFERSGNDLYQLLYIIKNDDEHDHLKNSDSHKGLSKRITVKPHLITLWLRHVDNKPDKSTDNRFLYQLEQDFMVSDSSYAAIRKLVSEWDEITTDQKQTAMTRLLQAMRAKAYNSELLPWLESLSRKRSFELKWVDNAETGEKNKDRKSEFWRRKELHLSKKYGNSGLAYHKWRRS